MALFTSRGLLEKLPTLLQPKRFKGKINIQRPRQPHQGLMKYVAITKPVYKSYYFGKKASHLCNIDFTWKRQQDNPFQQILANEVRCYFLESQLVGFYHLNPMSSDDKFKLFALLKKNDMHLKTAGRETIRLAVEGTKFEPLLELYKPDTHTIVVFSERPEIKTLLKINKKFPQILMLAAVFEGKFVSVTELLEYSLIPDVKTAQAQLVQTLTAPASDVVTKLNSHQTTLTSQLEERGKQLSSEEQSQ